MNGLEQINQWIQIFANFAVLVALIFTAYQIRLSLKTNEATLLQDLFDKNAELRKHFIQLKTTIPSYEELIKKCPDPKELRCLEKLEPLFQIGHHYEYIGLIVKKNLIRLDLVFELIIVDKEIWKNSEPVRRFLREQYLPDWWENWEHLHNEYERLRHKRNKRAPNKKIQRMGNNPV